MPLSLAGFEEAWLAGVPRFFWPAVKDLGIWLVVVGSLGMLLGSLGELSVRIEKHRRGEG